MNREFTEQQRISPRICSPVGLLALTYPPHWRTHACPTMSCLRAIHKLLSAISVKICAVFLASTLQRTYVKPNCHLTTRKGCFTFARTLVLSFSACSFNARQGVCLCALAFAQSHCNVPTHACRFRPLAGALVTDIGKHHRLLTMRQTVPQGHASWTLATVPMTKYTRAESAFATMGAFMPKCHWLPFLVWCIWGSRSPLVFSI